MSKSTACARTTSVGQDTFTFFTEPSVVAHVLCSASAVADRARTAGQAQRAAGESTKSHAAYEMARVPWRPTKTVRARCGGNDERQSRVAASAVPEPARRVDLRPGRHLAVRRRDRALLRSPDAGAFFVSLNRAVVSRQTSSPVESVFICAARSVFFRESAGV